MSVLRLILYVYIVSAFFQLVEDKLDATLLSLAAVLVLDITWRVIWLMRQRRAWWK